jgi:CelD/BcsL family acetyltransferase involved in cellulose biosynthesis
VNSHAAPASRGFTARGWRVAVLDDPTLTALAAIGRGAAPTPFQAPLWRRAWQDAVGRTTAATALTVVVTDAMSGRPALALDLVRTRARGLVRLTAPDAGVTDYNAPVLGEAAPTTAAEAEALVAALLRALPPADELRLEKMPVALDGRANPLALVAAARPMTLEGNVIAIPRETPFERYMRSLEKVVRKELERSWRVFERHEGARFVRLDDADKAMRVMDALEALQGARIGDLGRDYILDRPENRALYRALVRDGINSGEAVLTALMAGDTVVAALLGITSDRTFAMVRLAQAGGAWRNVSPGRLIIERTMRHLHGAGFDTFDFTIGSYDYKRRMGVSPRHLASLVLPLSLRGRLALLPEQAKAKARQSDLLRSLAARLKGR